MLFACVIQRALGRNRADPTRSIRRRRRQAFRACNPRRRCSRLGGVYVRNRGLNRSTSARHDSDEGRSRALAASLPDPTRKAGRRIPRVLLGRRPNMRMRVRRLRLASRSMSLRAGFSSLVSFPCWLPPSKQTYALRLRNATSTQAMVHERERPWSHLMSKQSGAY